MVIPALLQQFAVESEPAATGIGALGIKLPNLLLQMVAFGLFFLIVKQFAFKPIYKLLDERRQTIENGIRLGREMETEKAHLDEQVGDALRDARVQADRVVAEAHQEAGSIIKAAEATAERKGSDMILDAHARIALDVKKARAGLRSEVLGLVAEATEAIIDEKFDAVKDTRLVDKTLARVRQ